MKSDDGKTRSYLIGNTNENSNEWIELALPPARHFTKIISPALTPFSAIDDQSNLWLWSHEYSLFEMMPESMECFANGEQADAPNHFKWFTEKKLKVLDIEGGYNFLIALTEDAQGKREFYGLG